MQKKVIPLFLALCSLPFIMVLGNSMLIPILPLLKKELGINQFQAGLIITSFSIPTGLMIPIAGFLSDKWSRKAIMIPGIIIYGLAGGLAGLAGLFLKDPYYPILASRVLMGIGAAGMAQLAMAVTGDLFTSNERLQALGYIEAANGIGKVSSPIIGSTTALLSYYTPFFVYPILSFLSVLSILFFLPSPPSKEVKQSFQDYWKDMLKISKDKGKELLLALLTALNAMTFLFGILFFFSHIIEDVYQWNGIIRGLSMATPVMALSLVSILSSSSLKITQINTSIIIGLGTLAVSLFLISLFEDPLPLILSITLFGSGLGLILPGLNTLFTSSVSKEKRGMATSIYASVRFFGTALGPLLFSLVFSYPVLVFTFSITAIIINMILLLFFMEAKKLLPEER